MEAGYDIHADNLDIDEMIRVDGSPDEPISSNELQTVSGNDLQEVMQSISSGDLYPMMMSAETIDYTTDMEQLHIEIAGVNDRLSMLICFVVVGVIWIIGKALYKFLDMAFG